MSSKRTPSRQARRAEYQARRRRQRTLIAGLVAAAVVILGGFLYWTLSGRYDPENVTLPESLAPPPQADGKSWGPADAPVLIEEFSDFQ